MPTSTVLPAQTTPVFATDEDILIHAGGDFATLAPGWQAMAQGCDGIFASGSPWVLTSALTNFATNAVRANHVVHLTLPSLNFPGGGAFLAVDSVSGHSITLRRAHKDLAAGQPPAPAAGLTGVRFSIPTLDPQIEEASFEIKQRFNIDETILVRSSSYVYDIRNLRLATVLTVLLARYTQESRTDRGDFPRKIELVRRDLDEVLGRISLRWGSRGDSAPAVSSLFGAKVSR